MNLKELYQEIILEHGKNPRNLRKTENFNKDAKGNNPLCGDNVHVYLKLNDQSKVEDISFEGSGCAISMASASIMTDLIKGKTDNEAKEIIEDFLAMIKENPELKNKILISCNNFNCYQVTIFLILQKFFLLFHTMHVNTVERMIYLPFQ